MRHGARATSQEAEEAPEGPTLSPAEFAKALTELHSRPSLQSLCDATAHLGSAALGPTWVAILSRTASDEPLRPTAASGPDQARWPLEPPEIDADAVADLFARIDERGMTGDTVATVCGDALPASTSAALQQAFRPRIAGLAPVIVDGRRSGVVFGFVDGDVPHEAVAALVEHAAAATRSLLHIDLLRVHGDQDVELGVLARAALDRTVTREMVRARRYGRPLTLVVVRPRESGTAALRALGQTLEEMIRETDFIARLDETHLAVLLPETDQQGGQDFAARILEVIPGVYASAANYPADGATWEALVSAALAAELPLTAATAAVIAAGPSLGEPSFEARSSEESLFEGPSLAELSSEELLGDDTEAEDAAEPRPAPLQSRPTHVVGRIDERFPQHAGPPPRLRDMFPNFGSRPMR